MDKQECKLHQPLDICNRLFHFIMRILSSKAQETVTLGNPVPHGTQLPKLNASHHSYDRPDENANHSVSCHEATTVQTPNPLLLTSSTNDCKDDGKELQDGSRVASSPPQIEPKNNLGVDARREMEVNNLGVDARREMEEEVSLPPSIAKRAPKKMVSIKDSVEDIDSIMKQRRKEKGTKKLRSFESEHDASLKPSRSILKVGSDINDKFDSLNGVR